MSTKIHAVADALGNPAAFHLTGGQASDLAGADALVPQLVAPTLIADKGYDAEARVLAPLREAGKAAVQAALDHAWSSGQVEGQVNRLKLVKRAMFGRAGFAFLRRRFLLAS